MNRRELLGRVAAAAVCGAGSAAWAGQNTTNVDAGLPAAKQLLKLMDTDKNGKVSKAEFMAFMGNEFDRLDVNHDGELDVQELTQMEAHQHSGHTR
jgi:hypothetical protein